jgi:hypothetical protein
VVEQARPLVDKLNEESHIAAGSSKMYWTTALRIAAIGRAPKLKKCIGDLPRPEKASKRKKMHAMCKNSIVLLQLGFGRLDGAEKAMSREPIVLNPGDIINTNTLNKIARDKWSVRRIPEVGGLSPTWISSLGREHANQKLKQ